MKKELPVSRWRWRTDGPDEYVGSQKAGRTAGYVMWMHDNTFKAYGAIRKGPEIEFKRSFKTVEAAKAVVVKWIERNLHKAGTMPPSDEQA